MGHGRGSQEEETTFFFVSSLKGAVHYQQAFHFKIDFDHEF